MSILKNYILFIYTIKQGGGRWGQGGGRRRRARPEVRWRDRLLPGRVPERSTAPLEGARPGKIPALRPLERSVHEHGGQGRANAGPVLGVAVHGHHGKERAAEEHR